MAVSLLDELNAAQVAPDVSLFLNLIIKTNPLLDWIPWWNERPRADSTGLFQYPEEVRVPLSDTLAVDYVAAAGTMTFTGSDIIPIGAIFWIDNHFDANGIPVKFRADNVVGATVTKSLVGSGADTSITAAAAGTIRWTVGKRDGAAAGTGGVIEPTLAGNFLQLFQEDLDVGWKAQDLSERNGVFGIGNLAQRGMEQKMREMSWQMSHSIRVGVGQAESGSVPSMFKGIDEFINKTAFIRTDASAAVFSTDLLDDTIVKLQAGGLEPGKDLVVYSSPGNIREISDERAALIQYPTNGAGQDLGGDVVVYRSSIAGYSLRLIGDPEMPDKLAYVLDPDRISLVAGQTGAVQAGTAIEPSEGTTQRGPSGWAWLLNSTTPGTHGAKATIRALMSLRLVNAANAHATIFNIGP